MERQEVFDKVVAMVAERFELDPAKITGDLNFLTDVDADSIDFVELVLEMEDEFGGEIPDEDADQLTTINKTVDYIVNRNK